MKKRTHDEGFTLLELIVVLAGLGILSSLAIPNFIRLLDFNNIDEAKALLNTAAADCLQKSRINNADTKDTIDDEILSDKRLNTIGYKIDPDADKCSYLQLLPTNEDDGIRYPIGFSVADGKLSKFANPTSDDQASISSCINWAGDNCKQDESLKELIAWKQSIAEAKKTCEDNYANWLKTGTKPNEFNRWNPNADKDCPSRPPKDGSESYKTSSSCTYNGCNRTVYGLDGEFAGFTEQAYKKKLEEKYGRICTEKVTKLMNQSPPFTNPTDNAYTIAECGTQEFWFHKGKDAASEEEWRGLMCSDEVAKNINTDKKTTLPYCGGKMYYFCDGRDQLNEDKYNQCIANNAEAKCISDREKARLNGHKGQYGPVEGPGACGEIKWMCNGTMVESEEAYNATTDCGKSSQPKECGPPPNPVCVQQRYYNRSFCIDWVKCKGYM